MCVCICMCVCVCVCVCVYMCVCVWIFVCVCTVCFHTGSGSETLRKKIIPDPQHWLVPWSCRAGTRDFCPALAALVDPIWNIFSSPYTISIRLSPSPSKLGRQSCWVSCLIQYVSVVQTVKDLWTVFSYDNWFGRIIFWCRLWVNSVQLSFNYQSSA
jgi:hypothetical protein